MARVVVKLEAEAEEVEQSSMAAKRAEHLALLTGPFIKQVGSSTAQLVLAVKVVEAFTLAAMASEEFVA